MFKKKKKSIENEEIKDNNELNCESVELKDKENDNPKKKGFSIFKLIFYVIVAALLIAFGILLLIKKEESVFIIFITTGAVALIVAAIRVVYALANKEKDPKIKKVDLIIALIHGILATYLIVAGLIYNNDLSGDSKELSDFSKFNDQYYPVYLAALLYSEAVAYFMSTVLFKKNSKKFNFWLHIAFITIAVVILSLASGDKKNVSGTKIVVTIAIISLICGVISGTFAFIAYFNPSSGSSKKDSIEDAKEEYKEDEEDITLHLPTDDDDNNSTAIM